ncbi:DUF222 domain-containing protein [Cryobacterium arcticum]|uniref:HNH nuclease domain-containing protein n=1 Tax=Cryobacterium arcticum TaxID=670052 RepID=A0A1B1BHD8_9MICO|nr:DUF222 domain-containing protein [Cryobacterium arcticum]ANP72021.1 hypothetical protein PA27867_1055 [Cryobacterium arcticum]
MSSLAAIFAPDTVPEPARPASATVPPALAAVPVLAEVRPAGPAGSLAEAVAAVARWGSCSADYDALSDADALACQRDIARLSETVGTRQVWVAKTIAHRSRPELGQSGLAQQQGYLNPDGLIQKLTGSTKADARRLVDVGRMLADNEAAAAQAAAAAEDEAARRLLDELDGAGGDPESTGLDGQNELDGLNGPEGLDGVGIPGIDPALLPWHHKISEAVTCGALSVAAAHAIRTGLGDIDTVVTGPVLATAVEELLRDARTLNVDQLLKRARRTRDSLDAAGIIVREQKAWDDRSLRVWTNPSGQVHLHGVFPPEQGAFVLSAYDSLTSPRRGGVRFVDPARAKWAQSVRDDPRSTEQIAADGFLALLKAGTEINPNRILGGRQPSIRIITHQATPGTAPTPTPTTPGTAPTPTPTTPCTRTPATTENPTRTANPAATEHPGRTGTPSDTETTAPAGNSAFTGTDTPTGTSIPTWTFSTAASPTPAPHLNGPARPDPLIPPGPTSHVDGPARPDPVVPPGAGLLLLRDLDEILAPPPDLTAHGYLEGNPAPLSQPTLDRLTCDSGSLPITFSTDNQPLNLGRDERLFTPAQRIALAARDGGCRWGDCDKPPAFTETHHIDHWLRDHGTTDIRHGILLCNPHHRLLHNQGWQIFENQGHYWLRPPATIDPGQTLIEMPSKTPHQH